MTDARHPSSCYFWVLVKDAAHKGGGDKIKILVSFEDGYRSYQEVIAATIRIRCPRVEVVTSDLDVLEERLAGIDPCIVICSCSKPLRSPAVAAWVELPLDVTSPAKICVGGLYMEQRDPDMEILLDIIDKVEKLIHRGTDMKSC